jgi:predicted AAA+ superfamily ATPase
MAITERYLKRNVLQDLEKKMVFVGGPRQVGKTTMSKKLTGKFGYLNWDDDAHREQILRGHLPPQKLIILDELHKYRSWRAWIKGKFDTLKEQHQFLVTGSARLDYYRFGGDSLQGRYFYYRLHPLSVKELKIQNRSDFMELLHLSGFPEPYFSSSQTEYKRWARDYRTRLLRDDLRSLETIDDIGALELLVLRLPELVGSPLSINSLREDLQKSHKAVARWLQILERLYGIYRLSPFGPPKIKSVKKEQKHYHFDWALCPSEDIRLENLVSGHLLKWCHFIEDTSGEDMELRYFRDKDGREVDFVVTNKNKPLLFVEVKLAAKEISPHLIYLKRKFPQIPAFQVHVDEKVDYVGAEGIRCCPAWKLLNEYGV